MHKIKTFMSEEALNVWLENTGSKYNIIDIKFQFSSSTDRYMVWYQIK